ncbi:MAG: DUF2330 domain-containing protein [Alphaproteobacteria bacterium]|nr:DUF2330 domain-containing protein [Alphaproteobacteria bacterium]
METLIRRLLAAGALGLVLPSVAQAFCGTYVAGPGAEPRNKESRVVVARSGDATTLTMFNDVAVGDTVFGLVIPIPRPIDGDNVRLLRADVMADLEGYTSPRLVAYTCDSWYGVDGGGSGIPTARVTVPPPPGGGDTGGGDTGGGDTGPHDTGPGDADGGADGGTDSGFTPGDAGSGDGGGGDGGSGDGGGDDGDDTGSERQPEEGGAGYPSFGCGGGGSDPIHDTEVDDEYEWIDTGTGVIVDEWFTVGVYEAFVLQAETGQGLSDWLDGQGFALPPGADALLDEYVGHDARFLALRVELDEPADAPVWLPPVQVGYVADVLSLPLRLGTLSSDGVQDVVATFIADPGSGVMEPSNLGPASRVRDECLLDVADGSEFGTTYSGLWEEASGIPLDASETAGPGVAWTVEFSWDSGKCDPCPPDGPLSADQVTALGFPNAAYGWDLTRIRMRYTADGLLVDPVFYASGIQEQHQQRYIKHLWELESELPNCYDPQPIDPGTCYTAAYWAKHAQGETGRVLYEEPDGCKHHYAGLLLLILPLGLLRRRR